MCVSHLRVLFLIIEIIVLTVFIQMAFLKQVEEVMSLLVFENISTCPVKDFLGESQWLKTASEVNAAILSSFGKGNFLFFISLFEVCSLSTCTMLTSMLCL